MDKVEAYYWFIRGFMASGEGWNAEYPFCSDECNPKEMIIIIGSDGVIRKEFVELWEDKSKFHDTFKEYIETVKELLNNNSE